MTSRDQTWGGAGSATRAVRVQLHCPILFSFLAIAKPNSDRAVTLAHAPGSGTGVKFKFKSFPLTDRLKLPPLREFWNWLESMLNLLEAKPVIPPLADAMRQDWLWLLLKSLTVPDEPPSVSEITWSVNGAEELALIVSPPLMLRRSHPGLLPAVPPALLISHW